MVRTSLSILPALLLTACNSLGALSARSELLLSATMGEEEAAVASNARTSEMTTSDPDRPALFRECNTGADLAEIEGRYDADGDGTVSEEEGDAVFEGRDDRSRQEDAMMAHRWELMLLVYDLDGDGDLSSTEQAELEADFSARCAALHARLLEDFDADGDGELSAEEEEAARAALEARYEEMAGEHRGPPPGGEPPEGAAGEGPPEGAEGAEGEVDHCHRGPPPHMVEFDLDGDGELSESELSTLRDTLRERIRSGEPLFQPPASE